MRILLFIILPTLAFSDSEPMLSKKCEDAVMEVFKNLMTNNMGENEPYYMGIQTISFAGRYSQFNHIDKERPVFNVSLTYEDTCKADIEVHDQVLNSKTCFITNITVFCH